MENITVILIVSFGYSSQSGMLAMETIEKAIREAFPGCGVRRAFTSQRMIDRLKEHEGLEIAHVEEAVERAAKEGISRLIVQPVHLIKGYEFAVLQDMLKAYAGKYEQMAIALGEPLLSGDGDLDAVIEAVRERTVSCDDGKTAICLVGHGTESNSGRMYLRMQEKLKKAGYGNYYVGTLKAEPGAKDVLKILKEKGCYNKVVLEPLMAAAGGHVYEDIAGAGKNSWKAVMEDGGYEVECIFEGLGQMPSVCRIYEEHTREAMDSLPH